MKLKLIEKNQETEGIYTFVFKSDQPFEWQPGQFLKYSLPNSNPDERGLNRFFTIASSPTENVVKITTRFEKNKGSSFKKDLLDLQIGQEIEAVGPMGSFVLDDIQNQHVFIAGGIGITPFKSMVIDLKNKNLPINITLLYSSRDQNIVFKKQFDEIAKSHPEFKVHYIISPERIDQETLKSLKLPLQDSQFYISGPKPMVESMQDLLGQLDIPEDHVKHDYFPGYEGI